MTYRIALAPSAARQLRKFDPQVRRRIQAALELLAAEPRPPAATRLVGGSGEWRVRTSDYRIVYEIEDDRLLILVLRIGHRREIYHFWRAVTVRGQFERITGEGSATEAGGLTGTLSFDATSLTTKNKQRDNHLRSADFFDIENHPMVVLAVTEAKPLDGGALACKGTLEAAGHLEPIEFTAHVQDLTDRAVTMTADLVVDRLRFGMTWSPMRIAAYDAHVTVTARFVRA